MKLGDFGISKRVSNQSTALRTEVGTRAFSAPETTPDDYQETFQYTNAVDMWSLGCVIYNVLAHSLPYQNSHAKKFPFPTQPLKDKVNDQGMNLLECLLRVDPSIRWTAQKAAKHPWLEASCEASSVGVKYATENANSAAQPERPNESQNRAHHPDDWVDMPTVISSMEKTCPRPADRTEAPINQLASQSSNRHVENSPVDSSSNRDGRRRTTSNMMNSLSKYKVSDSFVDMGTETSKSRRASYHKPEDVLHELHEDDTTKKLTASPEMLTVVSRALNPNADEQTRQAEQAQQAEEKARQAEEQARHAEEQQGATQGESLMKVHHPGLTVRGRQELEEQGSENMELVTILGDLYEGLYTQEDDWKQTKIAGALELIRKGVNLEMRSLGETALHLAVRLCSSNEGGRFIPILHELLERGADVCARIKCTEYRQTVLPLAISYSYNNYGNMCGNEIEVFKQLIRYKADVNAKDSYSRTPLHCAALCTRGDYIDMLLAAGARINEVDKDGWTALHMAAFYDNQNAAKKFILAGINMETTTRFGQTALEVARYWEKFGVVEAIEEAQEQLRQQQTRERRSHRTSQSPEVCPTVETKLRVSTSLRLSTIRWLMFYAGTRQGAQAFSICPCCNARNG